MIAECVSEWESGRWGERAMGRWGDGENGRTGDGATGRVDDGASGRWGEWAIRDLSSAVIPAKAGIHGVPAILIAHFDPRTLFLCDLCESYVTMC